MVRARSARAFVIPALLIGAWEAASRGAILPLDTLSRPSSIAEAAVAGLRDGSILLATWQTFECAFLGWMIGSLLGILAGAALGLSRTLEHVTSPTIEALRPIPAVAFLPLALMIFGFGVGLEASIVAYACVWPVLIVTVAAVRGIEPRLLDVARALELSFADRLRKVVLRAAFARINVGLRIAAGIALVVAVTTEVVLNPRGLGYSLVLAQQSLQVASMYAQLFWLCVVGYALNAALRALGGDPAGEWRTP